MIRLEGVFTAIVTPFRHNRIDDSALRSLLRSLREATISGIVVSGTTGEGPALEAAEWKHLLEICIAEKGELLVVANSGSNNTAHSIARTILAHELGADAALVITPYYNKPTQAGMVAHFGAIANSCPLPLMLYNVPSRTGCELMPETCKSLLAFENIISLKQAVGNLDRIAEIRAIVGDRWTILSGEDSLFLPMLSVGAAGIVSVTANAVPKVMQALWLATRRGDWGEALRLHEALYDLNKELFVETSPAPIKAAMKLDGLDCGDPRLPLVPFSEFRLPALRTALTKAKEAL